MARLPWRGPLLCGHKRSHHGRGLCGGCFSARRKLQRIEGRKLTVREFLALREERRRARAEAFRLGAQSLASRGKREIERPVVDLGQRNCLRCTEPFTARHESQEHCSMWCAYPYFGVRR